MKPLKHDHTYICRIVNQEDGTRSKPLVCTPDQLFETLNKVEKGNLSKIYLDFVIDPEIAANLKPDDDFRDCLLDHPLMTAGAYQMLFLTQKTQENIESEEEQLDLTLEK